MQKLSKKKYTIDVFDKIPTCEKFEKIIYPILHPKRVEKRIGPPVPVLPSYLKEMKTEGNPFTSIKTSRIIDLKKMEKDSKDFQIQKTKDFPVVENVNRDTRMKFNANHELRELKYHIDMHEIFDEIQNPIKADKSKQQLTRTKHIPNTDYILEKRGLCLLDLALDRKEDQFVELDRIIETEEKSIQLKNEQLEKDYEAHENYLKKLCHKTSDTIKVAEVQVLKKNNVIEKVKRARYDMAHLNAECVKLEEEYLRLKTYKEFLRNCYKQRESKLVLERTSFMNDLKVDQIMQVTEKNKFGNDDSDSDNTERKSSLLRNHNFELNNYNDTEKVRIGNDRDGNFNRNNGTMYSQSNNNNFSMQDELKLTSTKGQLNQWKAMITLGFNNSNLETAYSELSHSIDLQIQSDTHIKTTESSDSNEKILDDNDLIETDTFFNTPQDLVNLLSELEAGNLSLIENVQEQDEMCDILRQKIRKIKIDVENQMDIIEKHVTKEETKIDNLNDSIACIKETDDFLLAFNNLDRYKRIFSFGNLQLNSLDELMDYLHEKISSLYHSIFEKVDSTKSNTVEMLRRVESLIDSLYLELQLYDKVSIVKAKKLVDERKREAARLRQKQLAKDAEALKLERAMEKARMPPRYRYGRKVVYRSDQPKPVVKVVEIDWDEIRRKEETEFFFT